MAPSVTRAVAEHEFRGVGRVVTRSIIGCDVSTGPVAYTRQHVHTGFLLATAKRLLQNFCAFDLGVWHRSDSPRNFSAESSPSLCETHASTKSSPSTYLQFTSDVTVLFNDACLT